jgi:hypothetical protein
MSTLGVLPPICFEPETTALVPGKRVNRSDQYGVMLLVPCEVDTLAPPQSRVSPALPGPYVVVADLSRLARGMVEAGVRAGRSVLSRSSASLVASTSSAGGSATRRRPAT